MSSYGWFNLECNKSVVFDIRLDLIGLKGIDGPWRSTQCHYRYKCNVIWVRECGSTHFLSFSLVFLYFLFLRYYMHIIFHPVFICKLIILICL